MTAWTSLKTESESIAKTHLDFSEALSLQLINPITAWLRESKKPRARVSFQLQNNSKLIITLIPIHPSIHSIQIRDQGRKITKDLQSSEVRAAAVSLNLFMCFS
jgi:hypothetical protein